MDNTSHARRLRNRAEECHVLAEIMKGHEAGEALPIVRTHQDDVCGLNEQGPEKVAPALADATQGGCAL
jgi:hypothetical protein